MVLLCRPKGPPKLKIKTSLVGPELAIISEMCIIVPYQNCINHFATLNKMATKAKNRNILKQSVSHEPFSYFIIVC